MLVIVLGMLTTPWAVSLAGHEKSSGLMLTAAARFLALPHWT